MQGTDDDGLLGTVMEPLETDHHQGIWLSGDEYRVLKSIPGGNLGEYRKMVVGMAMAEEGPAAAVIVAEPAGVAAFPHHLFDVLRVVADPVEVHQDAMEVVAVAEVVTLELKLVMVAHRSDYPVKPEPDLVRNERHVAGGKIGKKKAGKDVVLVMLVVAVAAVMEMEE